MMDRRAFLEGLFGAAVIAAYPRAADQHVTTFYREMDGARRLYVGTVCDTTDEWSYATATIRSASSVPDATDGAQHDLFCWQEGDTVRLERGPAWRSDTDRGYKLEVA